MSHFTLQISPEGALLGAFIGVSEARQAALKEAGQEPKNYVRIRALIDTGASATCVDPSVLIDSLQLTPTGKTTINTPSTGDNPVVVDQYDVSLVIPPAGDDETFLIKETLPVICADLLQKQGFHALIGRDVLASCLLFYNGSMGSFTLAY